MSDNQRTYAQIVAAKYKESLRQGALNMSKEQLERFLFRFWEEALAEFLIECDLPLSEQLRFKNMTRAEKRSQFKETAQYGFQEFLNNFLVARTTALRTVSH